MTAQITNDKVPFIRRVLNPELNKGKGVHVKGTPEDSLSSHYTTVSSDDKGKHYVHPTVFDTGKEKFEHMKDKSFDYALANKNYVKFDDLQEAIEFSENYKTEEFKKFKDGGMNHKEALKEKESQEPVSEEEMADLMSFLRKDKGVIENDLILNNRDSNKQIATVDLPTEAEKEESRLLEEANNKVNQEKFENSRFFNMTRVTEEPIEKAKGTIEESNKYYQKIGVKESEIIAKDDAALNDFNFEGIEDKVRNN